VTRAIVLGGGGFVGSHLADRLLREGMDVVVVDNFLTGRKKNLAHLGGNDRFRLVAEAFNLFDRKASDIDYFYT